MKIDYGFFSNPGPSHDNEDACFVGVGGNGLWAAVADGVGGHGDGQMASGAAVQVFAEWSERSPVLAAADLFRSIQARIREGVTGGIGNSRMATTFTALRLQGEDVEFGHVGDTRIYHIRDGGIVTRTRDQSEVQELLDRGILTRNQANKYPRRNILMSVLGADKEYDLMTGVFSVQSGDVVVLCTDGLHDVITKRDVLRLSSTNGSAQSIADDMVAAIRAAGPSDDYTAVVIRAMTDA